MTEEFKLALEALAKAGGLTVAYECTKCHCEAEPEFHEIVTFISPSTPEDES